MAAKVISSWQGIYSTKYRLLVSVPIAVSTAIASSMIPSLVSSFMKGEKEAMHQKVNMAVKFNMIIAFPSAVGLAVIGKPVLQILFSGTDYDMGSNMMILGSSCIIFYALSTVTSGVLQSIDQMRLPVIHALISLVVHIALVWGLMQFTNMGVYALVVGNVTYPLMVCVLNGNAVRKYLGLKQEMTRTFCIPLLASVVMGVLTWLTFYGIERMIGRHVSGRLGDIIDLIPAVIVAVAAYFSLILKLKGLTREELYEFPYGRKMSIVADKLHLL